MNGVKAVRLTDRRMRPGEESLIARPTTRSRPSPPRSRSARSARRRGSCATSTATGRPICTSPSVGASSTTSWATTSATARRCPNRATRARTAASSTASTSRPTTPGAVRFPLPAPCSSRRRDPAARSAASGRGDAQGVIPSGPMRRGLALGTFCSLASVTTRDVPEGVREEGLAHADAADDRDVRSCLDETHRDQLVEDSLRHDPVRDVTGDEPPSVSRATSAIPASGLASALAAGARA